MDSELTTRLRALAERRVPCPGPHNTIDGVEMFSWTCAGGCKAKGTIHDPKFAALVDRAVDHPDDIAANRHLRTDLETCVRVAAAHGLSIDFTPPDYGDRLWWCRMWNTTALVCRGQADNPTEAAWLAFLAWHDANEPPGATGATEPPEARE